MLTDDEIERRKPLWQALSDLWLDTEVDDLIIQYIIREMKRSNFSLQLVEKILSEEVAPVVFYNSFALPGGEWRGFHKSWLFPEIIKSIEKQEKNSFYRYWVKSSLGKFIMTKMVQQDWKIIVELYKEKLSEIEKTRDKK